MIKNLVIKWTISRGKDTYGHNICTLWDNDKTFRTCGGGYDMVGTVFAMWLQETYKDQLENLIGYDAGGYYGLFRRNGKTYLNGACGFSSIEAIARGMGLEVQRHFHKGNLINITVKDLNK